MNKTKEKIRLLEEQKRILLSMIESLDGIFLYEEDLDPDAKEKYIPFNTDEYLDKSFDKYLKLEYKLRENHFK